MIKRLSYIWAIMYFAFGVIAAEATNLSLYQKQRCLKKAGELSLVEVNREYGKFVFDNTKKDLSGVCRDSNAAGCFIGEYPGFRISLSFEEVSLSSNSSCIVPKIGIDFKYDDDTTIYVTKEYSSCDIRAVLRHELQHFTIWKIGQEKFFADVKQQIYDKVVNDCIVRQNCSYHSFNVVYKSIYSLVVGVEDKWKKIIEDNNILLDKVDHNDDTEVNYRVCSPYAFEMDLR